MEEMQNRSVHIIGNGDKHLLVDAALKEETRSLSTAARPLSQNEEISILPIRRFGSRTRAYLRIQDGCSSFCTYCIVPYTRGSSRSLSIEEVVKQAKNFEAEGYKEIVITGIHVGNYGTDLDDNIDIGSILDKLCRAAPNVRYRLSSIEPLEISENLLDTIVRNNNFMPHLHIPLQSGNDEILLRMNRRYSTNQFSEIVKTCKEKIDDVAIGLDILAGFPGETQEQFAATLSFLEKIDFTYLHVFPYSKRPGTPAADFEGQISKNVKAERVAALRKLSEKKKELFYNRYKNTIRTLLVEGKRDSSNRLSGFTDNYIPVAFQGDDTLKNSIIKVQLEKVDTIDVTGSIIQEYDER
jgi:threonylcarbamoyladenosine tRNA methylthiotransferase MtaB